MNEREIFATVLELPTEADRQAFLDDLPDPAQRLRIEHLLDERAQLGSFLEHPPLGDVALEPDATILQGAGSTYDDAGLDDSLGLDTMNRNPAEQDDEIDLSYLEPSARTDSLGRLAHYEILEVIGRGAFGTVLKAFDEKLQRIVAIKVLALELAAASPARKRFLREARASAKVRHENVVSIYNVEDEPLPYLVMEYIPGQTLQERLDDHGPLDVPDVLRLGKQIADGLAAAHAQDLIHRDVKPGNILLDTSVDDHVKITDFGLARTTDDASMTQSGMIAGTPLYMAPEQALGQKLDTRADLFSFGSVLYQMLSGRPPFRAPSTIAVLKRVTEDTPRPIQEIIPEVPDWMCELVGHLHAKQPDERYGSAKEVSKLLAACLADVEQGRVPSIPIPRHPTAAEETLVEQVSVKQKPQSRAAKHAARWPVLRIAALVLIVLFAGLAISEATGVSHLATTVIRLTTGSGTLVIETDDPGIQVTVTGDGEQVTIGGAGIERLTLRPGQYKIAARKDGKPVKQELVTITRDGRTVVRMSLEGDGQVTETGNIAPAHSAPIAPILKKELLGHSGKVFTVVFSPDGRLLSSGGERSVRVWDAQSGALRYALASKVDAPATAFSPDGKFLLTAPEPYSAPAPISIWEAETGKPAGVLEGHNQGIWELSFSPDGNTLLVGGWEYSVRLWDFAARRTIRDIPTEEWVRSTVCSSRGKIAIASTNQGKFFLCKTDGTPITTIEERASLLRFSPDGRRLAGANWWEGRVTIWDGDTGEPIASWRSHAGAANHVAFSPDGSVLATAGGDGKVRLWDVESQRMLAEMSHQGEAYGVAFSPDGTTLASTGTEDRLVKLWDVSAVLAQQAAKLEKSKLIQRAADALQPALAPFTDADVERIAALPAAEQIEEVRQELKRRNPDFDENSWNPVIVFGAVSELSFNTAHVTDITPLRALRQLRVLRMNCQGARGTLADLSPLEGKKLTWLELADNNVSDLSPLRSMPLEALHLWNWVGNDLSPLEGIPLRWLNVGGSRRDLDLTPLAGSSSLKYLCLNFTNVSDLTPLEDVPLTELECCNTQVSDLAPLHMMRLHRLWFEGSPVTDLSPLGGMPLKDLKCNFRPERDAAMLREIKTLEKINDSPAAEFWNRVQQDEVADQAWLKRVAALAAEQQVEEVRKELMRRNPEFDGDLTAEIEDKTVVGLKFSSDHVTDIDPVRALTQLQSLTMIGSLKKVEPHLKISKLSDLSPLEGMNLTTLVVMHSKVSDLRPLKGMPLETLNLWGWIGTDLSPLEGMPLIFLNCGDTKRAVDLAPLAGSRIDSLCLNATKAADLSALANVPLTRLLCVKTHVSDLTPLRNMPLEVLRLNGSPVTELSPLSGLPLKELQCDFEPARDAAVLRGINTLEQINKQPAARFWEDVEQMQAWLKKVDSLPAAEQIE